MFITALFIKVNTWKQLKLTDEWIKKCGIYTMKHYLSKRKTEICDNVDETGGH